MSAPLRIARLLSCPDSSSWRGLLASIPRGATWRGVAVAGVLAVLPFAFWALGSCMAWAAPATYRSSALVQVAPAVEGKALRVEVEKIRSGEVLGHAAKLLKPENGREADDPMAEYLLWSSLSVTADAGPNLVRLEASGSNPTESRRILMAVVEAYATTCATATGMSSGADTSAGRCVYLDSAAPAKTRVSDETRLALGVGGVAGLGLFLAIPLLIGMERWMPVRIAGPLRMTAARRLA